MVIYFSKINLESTELLKMYQEKSLDGMKKKLMNFFESGVVYEVEDSFKSNAGELHLLVFIQDKDLDIGSLIGLLQA